MKWLYLSVFLLLIRQMGDVEAQAVIDARFSTDTGSPLIGQPVLLTLTANVPQGVVITGWPEFPPQWSAFQVREVGELSISDNPDGSALYQQTVTVIVWSVGEYQTPDTAILYEVLGEEQSRAQIIEPAYFSVPSVLDPADTALRPLKPPIALPYVPPLLIAGVAAGAVALAAVALQRTWKGRPAQSPQAQSSILTPAKAALAELRRIATRNLSPVLIYQTVADTLRQYTQSQYNVQAMDMTTWELMQILRTRLPDATQADLQRMLEQADLVKFARYSPDADAAQRFLEMAGRWLNTQDADPKS
jgi:hypothetical protein